MSTDEQVGANIGVYVPVDDGSTVTQTLVAARQGLDYSESKESLDAAHADNYGYMHRIYGQGDTSLDVDGLLMIDESTGDKDASQQALQDALRNDTVLTVQVRYPGGRQEEISMLITEFSFSADFDGVSTYSASFEGIEKPETIDTP